MANNRLKVLKYKKYILHLCAKFKNMANIGLKTPILVKLLGSRAITAYNSIRYSYRQESKQYI